MSNSSQEEMKIPPTLERSHQCSSMSSMAPTEEDDGDLYDSPQEDYNTRRRPINRKTLSRRRSSFSDAASTILANPGYRFKTRSSLPWGHKPHPVLGASCLTYLFIVPFLLPCYPVAACMFALTSLCSYCSDHLYTGVDSMAHMFDKLVAPTTFVFAIRAIYATGGIYWVMSSGLAVFCHILAMSAAKQHNYNGFVLWHTLWHVVGVALIVTCCIVNNTMTECMVPGQEKDMGLWYGL